MTAGPELDHLNPHCQHQNASTCPNIDYNSCGKLIGGSWSLPQVIPLPKTHSQFPRAAHLLGLGGTGLVIEGSLPPMLATVLTEGGRTAL